MRAHPVPILVLSGAPGAARSGRPRRSPRARSRRCRRIDLRLDEPDGARPPSRCASRSGASPAHGVDRRAAQPARTPRPARRAAAAPTVVGIGASTGGPQALEAVLAGLPADFPMPVLVVQHIAAGFIDGLVTLARRAGPAARAARRATGSTPGRASGSRPTAPICVLEPSMRLVLDRETDVGPHRPSGDVLLESIAAAAGREAVGGRAHRHGPRRRRGVEAIRRAGG